MISPQTHTMGEMNKELKPLQPWAKPGEAVRICSPLKDEAEG